MVVNRRTILRGAAAGLAASAVSVPASGQAHEQPAASKPPRRGVNISGAEFGERPEFSNANPGVFGRDYTYNSERTVAYFAEQGITLLRVPFRWERIQPRLSMPLDTAELDRLVKFVGWAKAHAATVVLDVQNFGRYRLRWDGKPTDVIIDQAFGAERPVTREHFADLWGRLSAAFRDEPVVEAYGLMNEPHDMGDSDWKGISQTALDAIRATGDKKLVFIPGESYSNSDRFAEINGPLPWIKDPANNVAYEAHCYFDSNYSGTYAQSYDAELAKDKNLAIRGIRRLIQFAGWCSANGVRGFLGEFGVPGDDPRWLELLDHFLHALDRTGMDGCWWAAGEWWGDYKLSIQPRENFQNPAPQLAHLVRRQSS